MPANPRAAGGQDRAPGAAGGGGAPVMELLAQPGVDAGQPVGQGLLRTGLRKSFSLLVTAPNGAVG